MTYQSFECLSTDKSSPQKRSNQVFILQKINKEILPKQSIKKNNVFQFVSNTQK